MSTVRVDLRAVLAFKFAKIHAKLTFAFDTKSLGGWLFLGLLIPTLKRSIQDAGMPQGLVVVSENIFKRKCAILTTF
jgi:hypothetical protein